MANNTTEYFQCKKYKKVTFLCKGCSKEFCQEDFKEHEQLLNEELNGIINNFDRFRQKINEQKQNPNNHSLIQQIDQWERNSIRIIQQTAENYRQTVFEHFKIHYKEIEEKFNDLSKEIKEIQKENDFNEIELNDLRRKLNKINEDLINPSNISIREDPRGFIKQISIVLVKSKLKIESFI